MSEPKKILYELPGLRNIRSILDPSSSDQEARYHIIDEGPYLFTLVESGDGTVILYSEQDGYRTNPVDLSYFQRVGPTAMGYFCHESATQFQNNGYLPELDQYLLGSDISTVQSALNGTYPDLAVYGNITALKFAVEAPGAWHDLTIQAQQELDKLPSDALHTILTRYQKAIEEQPASHSKGHVARDKIHLAEIIAYAPKDEISDVDLAVPDLCLDMKSLLVLPGTPR
jgi:hypothetical protein